jgi:hypothetical protein
MHHSTSSYKESAKGYSKVNLSLSLFLHQITMTIPLQELETQHLEHGPAGEYRHTNNGRSGEIPLEGRYLHLVGRITLNRMIRYGLDSNDSAHVRVARFYKLNDEHTRCKRRSFDVCMPRYS